MAEARAKLGIIAARFDRFDEEMHAMLAKDLTVAEASTYFRGLSGADLPATSASGSGTAGSGCSGSCWPTSTTTATRYPGSGIRHGARTTRSASGPTTRRPTAGGSPEEKRNRRLDSVWFGTSHHLKQAAYRGALELAGVA